MSGIEFGELRNEVLIILFWIVWFLEGILVDMFERFWECEFGV